MKKLFSLCLALLILSALWVTPVSAAGDPIYDLTMDTAGICIYNPETDSFLYEKNADIEMFPASTTKIMTALVVLENCPDPKNTIVTVPDTGMFQYIIEDGGVNTQLVKGEEFTAYDLLLGLMMNSFCDVADLLAYHFGGGQIEVFIKMMNDKAAELGLEHTHFENAHGLHHPEHHSSPRDMAKILLCASQNETFREIISTRSYTIPATSRHAARPLRYTVDIYYERSDWYLDCYVGGKSGFTDQAGRCLATLAEKDGVTYVSVFLGANTDSSKNYTGNMAWIETHTLLSYAYENFEIKTVLQKGQVLATLPITDSEQTVSVVAETDVKILARKEYTPEYTFTLPEAVLAPAVSDGAKVGEVLLLPEEEGAEGSLLCHAVFLHDGTPIVTRSAIEKGAKSAAEAVSGIFSGDKTFVTLIILLLAVIAISIPALKITAFFHKKKAHRPKH